MSEALPIRVLAVDHTAGVPLYRKKFAALARQPGIELTVLAPDRWVETFRPVTLRVKPGEVRDGYHLRTGSVIWPGYENRGFFISGLARAIREARPDILHLWEEPYSFIAFQALRARRWLAPRARALFYSADNQARTFRYPYRPSALYKRIELGSFRRCERGTALSGEVVEVLRAKGYAGPIDVIAPALDPDDYPQGGQEAARGGRAPRIGFAGRLTPLKGVDTLLRAFAALPTAGGSPAELWIVGEGPERGALGDLARDLGIAGRVRFHGVVAHESMPAIYRELDLLVLPSRTLPRSKEQFGRVLIEAMASGCVVIGSSSGGIPEAIGDAGLVTPEEDAPAMAAAMARVLADGALAAELRERGLRRIRDQFTWEARARRLASIYEEMMRDRPRR